MGCRSRFARASKLAAVSLGPQTPAFQLARERANLGLPLDHATRLRFVKRVIYRVSWLFLKHQVTFNQSVLDALADVAQRQEELSRALAQQLEFGMRQANREIGDHIAASKSDLTRLQLQAAQITHELAALHQAIQSSERDATPGT